ncbi:MAG: hypothetical protein JWO13_1676 [Acidobacteriales bacterium]|nr:hypothetical protein [Terriglobales bacterium]
MLRCRARKGMKMATCQSCNSVPASEPFCPKCGAIPQKSPPNAYVIPVLCGMLAMGLVVVMKSAGADAPIMNPTTQEVAVPAPDAVAKILASCGKPDRDRTTTSGRNTIRTFTYRTQRVTAVFSRPENNRWKFEKCVDPTTNQNLKKSELARRLACFRP